MPIHAILHTITLDLCVATRRNDSALFQYCLLTCEKTILFRMFEHIMLMSSPKRKTAIAITIEVFTATIIRYTQQHREYINPNIFKILANSTFAPVK